jgi:hypothetical protein
MDEGQIEEKINHLEKRVTDGFARMKAGCAHINSLIKPLANTCAREFTAINGHLAKVDDRLETIDGKIEAFARRMDDGVNLPHSLSTWQGRP